MLILEIALGIVLGFIILFNLRIVFFLCLIALFLCLIALFLCLIIFILYNFFYEIIPFVVVGALLISIIYFGGKIIDFIAIKYSDKLYILDNLPYYIGFLLILLFIIIIILDNYKLITVNRNF